jgi:hypothetical protein
LCQLVPETYSARQVKFEPWLPRQEPQLKLVA